MAKKTRRNFFLATRADILGILTKLEEARPVQYVRTGDYLTPEPPIPIPSIWARHRRLAIGFSDGMNPYAKETN